MMEIVERFQEFAADEQIVETPSTSKKSKGEGDVEGGGAGDDDVEILGVVSAPQKRSVRLLKYVFLLKFYFQLVTSTEKYFDYICRKELEVGNV